MFQYVHIKRYYLACYKTFVYLPINDLYISSLNSVLEYFHNRLTLDCFFLLDPYLTRLCILLSIQDVCTTFCEKSSENDISNCY